VPSEDLLIPTEGLLVAHFIAVAAISRSRAFYSQVLGGIVVMEGRAQGRSITSPGTATEMGPVNVWRAASTAEAGSVSGHRWVSTSCPT
jgi:hypothetical protein